MDQNYNLNLIPGKVPVTVHVKQYDTSLRNIIFTIYSGDSVFTIPFDSTVTVSGTKPDGNGFSYSCTFSGSEVNVPMQTQMTPLPGEFPCQLTIGQSGGVIGTASFILAVEAAALAAETPVSDTDLAMFQELATQTQTEAAAVANASEQIAANATAISAINTKIGTTSMGTTAVTLTGAIAEHEGDITWLNNKFIANSYHEGTTYSFTIPYTPSQGHTYLVLMKNWTSNTTFLYDLAALTFTSATAVYVDFIQKNTTSTISSVSVSGTTVTITFSATKYMSIFLIRCG